MSRNFRVGIVGATGIAGQQFVVALQGHPWFTIARLAASARSAGKPFGQALLDPKTGARRWWCAEEPAPNVQALPVENGDTFDPEGLDVVFSATESDVALVQEPRFAKTTAVGSTASAFRHEADVPLLVPNVNMDHATLIHRQRAKSCQECGVPGGSRHHPRVGDFPRPYRPHRLGRHGDDRDRVTCQGDEFHLVTSASGMDHHDPAYVACL